MIPLWAFSLNDLGTLLQNPWSQGPWKSVINGAILLGGAIVGGIVLGFAVRFVTMLLWRNLSAAAIFRFRLLGGLFGAALAYTYLGYLGGDGRGPGFGRGPGGLPGQL